MSAQQPPWTNLAGTIQMLQSIMSSALRNGGDEASQFVELSFTLGDERAATLAAQGIDVTDDWQLFTYVMGFSHAVGIAHAVVHSFEYHSAEVEDDDEQCTTFVFSTLSNLTPLLQVLPLHLIMREQAPDA